MEADESYFVLNPAADWQPVEIVEKRSDVGRFGNFENEASRAVGYSLNLIKENLRRASKESISVIKPGENKRGDESVGGYKRKIPSN